MTESQNQTYLTLMKSHIDGVLGAIVDPEQPFWPSVVDVSTGKYPEGEHIPKRVYRLIGAPRGTTPYWDQPLIVAALHLAHKLSNDTYKQVVEDYMQCFLDHCVAPNGIFQWGNHMYYDIFEKHVVAFYKGYHEMRPLTPAWDMIWALDGEKVEANIREAIRLHTYDTNTGGFNRHDDQKKSHAFIESGGILVESQAWLYKQTNDPTLLEGALKTARYSFSHCNPDTGLLPNEPDFGRWDSKVCTTEVGVWAQSLLRAFDYTQEAEFKDLAEAVIRAYLTYGFDEDAQQYRGQVSVATGEHVVPEELGYWPRQWANPWNTDQWPTHDYPAALGEACVILYQHTDDQLFKDAVYRLTQIMESTRPSKTGEWTYADNYGRSIHLLARASKVFNDETLKAQAHSLAAESIEELQSGNMIQGYKDAGVYESVDGVGYLFLALLELMQDDELDLMGFGF